MDIESVQWIEMQSTANIYGWGINERKLGNLSDPETRGLVYAGLLVIVDDETRAALPPPSAANGGCGCSS